MGAPGRGVVDNRPIDDQPVIEILKRLYDAWNRRDIDAGLAEAAEDMVWHGPPDSPFAGPHEGAAQVRRFAEGIFELFDRIVREPQSFERHGSHTLVEVTSLVRGAGSGVEVEVALFDVWGIDDDGRVHSYAVFSERVDALRYIERNQPAATPVRPG